jgi:hypothetical protein
MILHSRNYRSNITWVVLCVNTENLSARIKPEKPREQSCHKGGAVIKMPVKGWLSRDAEIDKVGVVDILRAFETLQVRYDSCA